MTSDTLIIYTDGASRGNPGQASIAAVIYKNQAKIGEYGKHIGLATNNEAEYQAVIMAMQKAKALKVNVLHFFLDSELAVKHLNHQYKLKDEKIIPLFIKIWNSMLDFKEVTFTHIPREKNKEADNLANKILDNQEKQQYLL